MRRLTSLLLSLEHDHPTVDTMLTRFAEWEAELSPVVPADPTPRLGADPDGAHRVYLQHALDIGSFNPCFPTYEFVRLEPDSATGRVTFPVAYEGPPGSVHGGFLGVFFDCIVQHHNCATAPSGMTRTMSVSYRRPVPLLTELRFDVTRVEVERKVTSTARLLRDDELLCVGAVDAVVVPPERLTGFDFGSRRTTAETS
jgi:acyl-coenzyme A thioesterase PaaI-like protein